MTQGKRVKLSNGRRLVDDIVRIANRTPLASFTRDLDLSVLNSLRRGVRPKISWNVIMMKAYGIVCSQRPELRRAYVRVPWPHFYESDKTVCMLTMSREYQGEERLFFARFDQPGEQSLRQLQSNYNYLRKKPVNEISQFRTQIRFARAPWMIRSITWWSLCNLWLSQRAKHLGTFGMSFSGHRNAYGTQVLGPNTTTIGIDPLPRSSISRLLFTFDHRVIDGAPAAEVIDSIRRALIQSITHEMKCLLREQGQNPELYLKQTQSRQNRNKTADQQRT